MTRCPGTTTPCTSAQRYEQWTATLAERRRFRISTSGGMGGDMAETTIEQAQLATRIPKDLHRRLKLYCVQAEVSLMDFVTDAVREKLRGKGRRKRGAR